MITVQELIDILSSMKDKTKAVSVKPIDAYTSRVVYELTSVAIDDDVVLTYNHRDVKRID